MNRELAAILDSLTHTQYMMLTVNSGTLETRSNLVQSCTVHISDSDSTVRTVKIALCRDEILAWEARGSSNLERVTCTL